MGYFRKNWAEQKIPTPTGRLVVYKNGIGFEKDSILFYSEVRGMVPSQDQQIVDMIVSEEKKHLSELTYVAGKLKSGTKLGSPRLQGAT